MLQGRKTTLGGILSPFLPLQACALNSPPGPVTAFLLSQLVTLISPLLQQHLPLPLCSIPPPKFVSTSSENVLCLFFWGGGMCIFMVQNVKPAQEYAVKNQPAPPSLPAPAWWWPLLPPSLQSLSGHIPVFRAQAPSGAAQFTQDGQAGAQCTHSPPSSGTNWNLLA